MAGTPGSVLEMATLRYTLPESVNICIYHGNLNNSGLIQCFHCRQTNGLPCGEDFFRENGSENGSQSRSKRPTARGQTGFASTGSNIPSYTTRSRSPCCSQCPGGGNFYNAHWANGCSSRGVNDGEIQTPAKRMRTSYNNPQQMGGLFTESRHDVVNSGPSSLVAGKDGRVHIDAMMNPLSGHRFYGIQPSVHMPFVDYKLNNCCHKMSSPDVHSEIKLNVQSSGPSSLVAGKDGLVHSDARLNPHAGLSFNGLEHDCLTPSLPSRVDCNGCYASLSPRNSKGNMDTRMKGLERDYNDGYASVSPWNPKGNMDTRMKGLEHDWLTPSFPYRVNHNGGYAGLSPGNMEERMKQVPELTGVLNDQNDSDPSSHSKL